MLDQSSGHKLNQSSDSQRTQNEANMLEQKNMEFATFISNVSQESFLGNLPSILIADDEPYN